MSLLTKKYNWTPGSMHNDNHDYEVYKNHYKEDLLNYDSEICTFNSKIDFRQRKFIRPTLDTKTFTGRVFDFYEWKSFLNSVSKSGVNMNTKIQVSSVKQLYNENRFWIVNGKIVTFSTYRIGGRQLQSYSLVENEAIEFVQKMIKKFQLAEAFVMDVAKTENGYKIVECGCINCAGFYDSDLQELIIKLENHFG